MFKAVGDTGDPSIPFLFKVQSCFLNLIDARAEGERAITLFYVYPFKGKIIESQVLYREKLQRY